MMIYHALRSHVTTWCSCRLSCYLSTNCVAASASTPSLLAVQWYSSATQQPTTAIEAFCFQQRWELKWELELLWESKAECRFFASPVVTFPVFIPSFPTTTDEHALRAKVPKISSSWCVNHLALLDCRRFPFLSASVFYMTSSNNSRYGTITYWYQMLLYSSMNPLSCSRPWLLQQPPRW